MKTATCHEISEWNYSCNNRIYTLRTNRSLVLQPEIPLTTTLILFLALKGRKLRGVLFPPTAVAKGGGIKSADVPRQITWEPDYQRIHLTVIFATTPIFLGFINWKGSDPPPHLPTRFPKVPWLSVSIYGSPLIYTSLPTPTIFRRGQHHPRWGRRQSNRKKPQELLFIFVFPTWIRNLALILFDMQMALHASWSAWQDVEGRGRGGALTRGLVFCSSHVPNLVDLWIILSGFNYTNPWKIARWLKKIPEKTNGTKLTLVTKAQQRARAKQS